MSTKEEKEEGSVKGESEGEEEEDYEVEEIIDHRFNKPKKKGPKVTEYEVKWKGYGWDETTWEPEDNLCGCEEILRLYKEKHKLNVDGQPEEEEEKEKEEKKPAKRSRAAPKSAKTIKDSSDDDDLPISKAAATKPEKKKPERKRKERGVSKESSRSEKSVEKERVDNGDTEMDYQEKEVSDIVGCQKEEGETNFLVKFKNGKTLLIPQTDAREAYPGKLCDFLLKHLDFKAQSAALSIHNFD